jgi:hypothetical protein
MANKKRYIINSGEGEQGTLEITNPVTPIGLKRILTRERCGGDRWAKAYEYAHDIKGGVLFMLVNCGGGENDAQLELSTKQFSTLCRKVDVTIPPFHREHAWEHNPDMVKQFGKCGDGRQLKLRQVRVKLIPLESILENI